MKSLSENSQQQSVFSSSSQWSLCSDWLVETGEPLTAARQAGAGWKKSGNFEGKQKLFWRALLLSCRGDAQLSNKEIKSFFSLSARQGPGGTTTTTVKQFYPL